MLAGEQRSFHVLEAGQGLCGRPSVAHAGLHLCQRSQRWTPDPNCGDDGFKSLVWLIQAGFAVVFLCWFIVLHGCIYACKQLRCFARNPALRRIACLVLPRASTSAAHLISYIQDFSFTVSFLTKTSSKCLRGLVLGVFHKWLWQDNSPLLCTIKSYSYTVLLCKNRFALSWPWIAWHFKFHARSKCRRSICNLSSSVSVHNTISELRQELFSPRIWCTSVPWPFWSLCLRLEELCLPRLGLGIARLKLHCFVWSSLSFASSAKQILQEARLSCWRVSRGYKGMLWTPKTKQKTSLWECQVDTGSLRIILLYLFLLQAAAHQALRRLLPDNTVVLEGVLGLVMWSLAGCWSTCHL